MCSEKIRAVEYGRIVSINKPIALHLTKISSAKHSMASIALHYKEVGGVEIIGAVVISQSP